MKLRLDTPIAKLTVDLTDEQVFDILNTALNYATGFSPKEVPAPVLKELPKPTPPIPAKVHVPTTAPEEPKRNPKVPDPPAKTEYKGFLYLKCEECGKYKGFMPKSPISTHRCDCGHTTTLQGMKRMTVDCKCGQKFKYLTNATDSTISIDCINCGSPVDLEYHERKHEYVTIGGE